MRFLRLELSHFRAVDHAQLELGPGLNVLYGPNDLGKTTLASALRAALLLPADSSAHQAFLPWHSKEQPRVVLSFELNGSSWRIQKTFGAGSSGQALLESSLDGTRFREEGRGRAVDGRLRELLRWGVEAPGGRSGPRGLPESFLSHVLLATQGSVAAILERTLEADRDGSGREWLHGALQALAQDPVFQRVLQAAEEKVESAFTATGRRKLGQNSPFASLRQNIAELVTELERLSHQRRESDEVQQRIAASIQERLEADELAQALRERVSAESAALAELSAQRALRERAARAQGALESQRAAEQQLSALGAELEQARAAGLRHAQQAAEAAGARMRAEGDAQRAEAELRELSSEASRTLRAERLAGLERERAQLELRIRTLQRLQELERAVAGAEAALATDSAALAAAERATGELAQRAAREEQQLERARRLEAVARWRDAQQALERAAEARRGAAELGRSAHSALERAQQLQAAAERLPVLSAATLAALRDLDRRLRVARARVEVGVSVALSLPPGRAAAISVDGGPAQQRAAEARPIVALGRSQVRVQLADDVQLLASAGDAQARAEAERLEAEWRERAQPLLVAADAPDIDALARLGERAEAERRGAEAARAEAQALQARAAEKAEQGAELEVRQERARGLAAAIGAELEPLERELTQLGAGWERALARQVADAERESRQLQAARLAQATALERLAARVAAAAATRDTALAERERSLAGLGAESTRPSAPLPAQLAALQQAFAAATQKLSQEDSGFRSQLGAAERSRDAARAAFERASKAHEAALERSLEGRERELALAAQLSEREKHFDPAALPAAEAELARARAELAALPAPPALTPETLAASQRELQRAEARLAELVAELRRAEGALGQVGGEVVVQRESQTREALERARELERDLELDFDAYQLLAKTLREVENEEGAHLGRALSEPVSERFARLTAGRYGRVGLDAALGFEGITVAGQARAYRELSEGTQEQLATIFRLCVAEQLRSTLVLDDHLAQTHRERVAWFRGTLREAAQQIQVVILTARPEDYLSPEELVASQQEPSPLVRSIDLERVIQRARYAPA